MGLKKERNWNSLEENRDEIKEKKMTELGTDIELESRIDGGYWLTDPN